MDDDDTYCDLPSCGYYDQDYLFDNVTDSRNEPIIYDNHPPDFAPFREKLVPVERKSTAEKLLAKKSRIPIPIKKGGKQQGKHGVASVEKSEKKHTRGTSLVIESEEYKRSHGHGKYAPKGSLSLRECVSDTHLAHPRPSVDLHCTGSEDLSKRITSPRKNSRDTSPRSSQDKGHEKTKESDISHSSGAETPVSATEGDNESSEGLKKNVSLGVGPREKKGSTATRSKSKTKRSSEGRKSSVKTDIETDTSLSEKTPIPVEKSGSNTSHGSIPSLPDDNKEKIKSKEDITKVERKKSTSREKIEKKKSLSQEKIEKKKSTSQEKIEKKKSSSQEKIEKKKSTSKEKIVEEIQEEERSQSLSTIAEGPEEQEDQIEQEIDEDLLELAKSGSKSMIRAQGTSSEPILGSSQSISNSRRQSKFSRSEELISRSSIHEEESDIEQQLQQIDEEYLGEGFEGDGFYTEAIREALTIQQRVCSEAEIREAILEQRRQLFNRSVELQPHERSSIYPLRKYHSDPCLPLPFDKKFQLSTSPEIKLKPKALSADDIHLSFSDCPELTTGQLEINEEKEKTIVSNSIREKWIQVSKLEKCRYSFFQELLARGLVLDSLEVLNDKGELVEAEPIDFRRKIDYARMVFKTKNVYIGNLVDWDFDGQGKYIWIDGTIYEGNFEKGQMHGKGKLTWPDGSIYEGEFINGKRAGWATYNTQEGYKYSGDMKDGLPNGKGRMIYTESSDLHDYYEGQWENGLPHGFGTRLYQNGDRYVGDWENGTRNGQGTMVWLEERQIYRGAWLDGVPHGQGEHIWYLHRTSGSNFPTRHVYNGEWFEGRRHGIGRMIYPSGSIYEGGWKQGQRQGKGAFVSNTGEVLLGLFRAGAIVGGDNIPLHTPTYECDYGGLVEFITKKLKLKIEDEQKQEDELHYITLKYLGEIRHLYKRAGEFSQWWGNHGLYPHWMKKSKEFSQGLEHMQPQLIKIPAPDDVCAVTRLGLCRLIKDCPHLLDSTTMAFYDKIWTKTPTISFQTQHNPFESVYLWQFLQCLVVVAASMYMEIPKELQQRFNAAIKNQNIEKQPSVEMIKPPFLEEEQSGFFEPVSIDDSNVTMTTDASDNQSDTAIDSDYLIEPTIKGARSSSTPHLQEKTSFLTISEAFEKLLVEKLIPCLNRDAGIHLPHIPNPMPCLADLFDNFKEINNEELINLNAFMQYAFPHLTKPNPHPIFKTLCSTILTSTTDWEYLLELLKQLQQEEEPTNLQEDEAEEDTEMSLGSEFLGRTISNAQVFSQEMKNLVPEEFKKHFGKDELNVVAATNSENDFVTESLPFAESDLVGEPFLWKPQSKCVRTKNRDMHAFKNLNKKDFMNVLKHLYPILVGDENDPNNLNFDMIFCDWLWCISLSAKASCDKDFKHSDKEFKEERVSKSLPSSHHIIQSKENQSKQEIQDYEQLIQTIKRRKNRHLLISLT